MSALVETYHIRARVLRRENRSRLGRGDLEIGDDGHGLDLLGPGELDVMANPPWWVRGPHACVDASRRGREDLGQWDLCASRVLGSERLEVGAHEAPVQGGTHIVGMALCMFPPWYQ